MKRAMVASVFVAGLVAGYFIAGYSETTVLAQRPWQCKSWEMDSKTDNTGAIGTFLGSASNVQASRCWTVCGFAICSNRVMAVILTQGQCLLLGGAWRARLEHAGLRQGIDLNARG